MGEAHRLPGAGLRVVAVEDDRLFGRLLGYGLERLGFAIRVVPDGPSLDAALQEGIPDLVILDLGLPGEDGFSIARRLRNSLPRLGLVMLTARGEVEDRLRGFEGGADLYWVKPVDLRVLAAAMASLHRRISPSPSAWRIQSSALHAPGGAEVPLTHNEHLFLARLAAESGQAVPRDHLMEALGYAPDPSGAHRLDTLVSRLRSKVRRVAPGHELPVKPRHGCGYVLLGA